MTEQQSHESRKTSSTFKLGRVVLAAAATAAAVGAGGMGGYFVRQPPSPPEVYFSPDGGCTDAITGVIKGAETDIRVQAYAFDPFKMPTASSRLTVKKGLFESES